MKIYNVADEKFKEYGSVMKGYDFTELLSALSELPIPDTGIVYEASVEILEKCSEKVKLQNNGFGAMPIQIGYVGGNNKILNCLEYHKSSEFNIALDDVVLVLGKQTQIQEGKFDTALCKAFLVPAGTGVELYGTTLHYAPMNVGEAGYRVACVLPLGTNDKKTAIDVLSVEDEMCAGKNKWLMAHKDTEDAKNGTYVGLTGENITFDQLD